MLRLRLSDHKEDMVLALVSFATLAAGRQVNDPYSVEGALVRA